MAKTSKNTRTINVKENSNKLKPIDQDILVSELRDMALKGFRHKDIQAHGMKKWKLSGAQTQRYIKQAHDGFLQIDKKVKGQLRAKYRERLEMMFHDALINKSNLKLALSVQCELNKLLNLYQDDFEGEKPAITLIFKEE